MSRRDIQRLVKIITKFDKKGMNQANKGLQDLDKNCKTISRNFDKLGRDISNAQNRISHFGQRSTSQFRQLDSTMRKTFQPAYISRFSSTSMSQISALHNKFDHSFTSIESKGNSTFRRLGNSAKSFGARMENMANGLNLLFGGIALKGLWDFTIGAAMENQQMEELVKASFKDQKKAQKLLKMNKELVKGTNLMPAEMNKAMGILGLSGLQDDDLIRAAPSVVKVGQNLGMQGWTGKQLNDYMTSIANGLYGDFRILKNNLKIDKTDLMKKGWSGKETDVKGYFDAFEKVTAEQADVNRVMDSTAGKMIAAENRIKTIGIMIGDVFLPVINKLLTWFLKLDEGTQKWIIILGVVGATIIAVVPFIVLIGKAFYDLGKAIYDVVDKLSKINFSGFKDKLSSAKEAMISFKDKSVSAYNTFKTKTISAFTTLKTQAITGFATLKAQAITAFTTLKTQAITGFTLLKTQAITAFTTLKVQAITGFAMLKAGVISAANTIKTQIAEVTAFMMANPILALIMAIIAAIILTVVAIEKLGEYMGWWDDWGDMVDVFKEKICEMGQAVWDEIVYIGEMIQNAPQYLKDKVFELGDFLVKSFYKAIGRGSPGLLAEATDDEMKFIKESITKQIPSITHNISGLGKDMVSSYKKPTSDLTTPFSSNKNLNNGKNINTYYSTFEVRNLTMDECVATVTRAYESMKPISGGLNNG